MLSPVRLFDVSRAVSEGDLHPTDLRWRSRAAAAAAIVPMLGGAMFVAAVALQRGAARLSRGCPTQASAFLSSTAIDAEKAEKRPSKSPIYTRTGDKGSSSLYSGERRSKSDMIFHALGNQDELNAVLGVAREYCIQSNNSIDEMLVEIQSRLFDLGAAVATPLPTSSETKINYTKFCVSHTQKLELWIDKLDSELPRLNYFILPSGGLSASHLQLARAVCRRAERSVVPLVSEGLVDEEVGRYLNRLSDFLFVAARSASFREGREETPWAKSTAV